MEEVVEIISVVDEELDLQAIASPGHTGPAEWASATGIDLSVEP